MNEDLLIIIPAFNEEKSIGQVLEGLKTAGFANITVVDDGSSDQTKKIAIENNAKVLAHPVNIGVGGAISTGIAFAKRHSYKYAITLDADGQHAIKDVEKILQELKNYSADIIIGSRLSQLRKKYPLKFTVNLFSNLFVFLLSGKYISDTQSGLRGLNRKAIEKLEINTSGHEYCSEIIVSAQKQKLTIKEIPIEAIYTDYSKRKGQKLSNALNIMVKLLTHEF